MNYLPHNLGPFQFEPRVPEEELIRRRNAANGVNIEPQEAEPDNRRDRDMELQARLEGLIPRENWCDCGNCRVPQNPTRKMVQCCHEHKALEAKLEDTNCITEHPDFGPVALTPAVLHIIAHSMIEVRGYGVIDEWTNRVHRYIGYRSYTYWVHGSLGRYNRRATPACVVLKIRETFPEDNDEDYVSYRDAEDEVGDAWNM